MANATKYVDNVNGNNANTGDSEAQAYADIPTAIAAISGGGNTIYVQAGANYTLTSTIALTAALKGDTTDGRNRIEGYTTTPGSRDGRPVITSATNSVALFTLNDNDNWDFVHLNLTHTAGTRGHGFVANTSNSSGCRFADLVIDGCNTAISSNSAAVVSSVMERCEVKNCTTTGATLPTLGIFFGNYIHDNAGDGIGGSFAPLVAVANIFDTNGRDGINEATSSGSSLAYLLITGNVFYANGRDGLRSTADVSGSASLAIANNVFYGNAGYGQNWTNLSAAEASNLPLCSGWNAYGGNTSGDRNGVGAGTSDVTLTADPFTGAGAGNFALNSTAGGGAACRAAGFPGAFPGGLTTGYLDIGAVQHQDAGGGGAAGPVFRSRVFGG